MVNYRHRHHAGSVHDLVKHLAFVTLLSRLNARAEPWFCLDTHAGEGWYETGPEDAPGEADEGVLRLLARGEDARHPLLRAYVGLLRAFAGPAAPAGAVRVPGSPALAAMLARPGDRVVLVDNTVTPRLPFPAPAARPVQVHRRDAWEALGALLPPPEGRGLVLVDPPYESLDEGRTAGAALTRALGRFPAGRFLVWYPLSRRARPPALGAPAPAVEALRIEAVWAPAAPVRGSGLLVLRPSEECREALPAALRELLVLLGLGGRVTVLDAGRGPLPAPPRRARSP